MPQTHVERGRLGESLAALFLELRGYRIVERNWRFHRIEVDLIAERENLVAIVEVKFRLRAGHGGAVGAVGPRKRRDLETAAVAYTRLRGRRDAVVRFDVVAIDGGGDGAITLRHLPGAFRAEGRWRA